LEIGFADDEAPSCVELAKICGIMASRKEQRLALMRCLLDKVTGEKGKYYASGYCHF
jgi:hypothetical protein